MRVGQKPSALLIVFVLLGAFTVCAAEEDTASEEDTTIYFVCTGNCSRSMRASSSYESLEEAVQAMQRARENFDIVGILVGDPGRAWMVHPSFRSVVEDEATFELAVLQDGDWSRIADLEPEQLRERAEELRAEGRQVQLIVVIPEPPQTDDS